VMLYQLS